MTRRWDGSLAPLPIDVAQVEEDPGSEAPADTATDTPTLEITCLNGKVVVSLAECGDNEHPGQDEEAATHR